MQTYIDNTYIHTYVHTHTHTYTAGTLHTDLYPAGSHLRRIQISPHTCRETKKILILCGLQSILLLYYFKAVL